MHLGFCNVLAPCPTAHPQNEIPNSGLQNCRDPSGIIFRVYHKSRLLLLMQLFTAVLYKKTRCRNIFCCPSRKAQGAVSRNRATCRKPVRRSGTIAPRTCQKGLVALGWREESSESDRGRASNPARFVFPFRIFPPCLFLADGSMRPHVGRGNLMVTSHLE